MTGGWGRLHDTWGQGSGAAGKHPGFWELLLMDCGKETKRGWLELTSSDRSHRQPRQMPSAPRTSVRLALGVQRGQKQEKGGKGGPGGWAGEGQRGWGSSRGDSAPSRGAFSLLPREGVRNGLAGSSVPYTTWFGKGREGSSLHTLTPSLCNFWRTVPSSPEPFLSMRSLLLHEYTSWDRRGLNIHPSRPKQNIPFIETARPCMQGKEKALEKNMQLDQK